MRNKKLLATLTALTLTVSSLTACSEEGASTTESASQSETTVSTSEKGTEVASTSTSAQATAGTSASESSKADESIADESTSSTEDEDDDYVYQTVDEALASVAELNGCEVSDLNYCIDDYGFVNFLGAPFTEKTISDVDDAMDAIDDLINIAGLGGCYFSFYREDVSPVTGFTYYTFSQVAPSEDDEIPITYSHSQIRIIADAAGNSAGFSADTVPPDSITPLDKTNMVEQTEAEYLVQQQLAEGAKIINEMTVLSYWDDEYTASSVSEAKMIPAWLIYTNETKEGKPYSLYIIPAIRDAEGNATIADIVPCASLNVDDGSYTSNVFFEGMEDAGYMTCTVDMTWAYEANSGYQADEELELSIPVMYDPENGLYYLADVNEKIALANWYDFINNTEINAIVSETPEDMDSWHFASMTGPNGENYFCDMNYILSSYDTMMKTYNIYKDRYGYNSVDHSGLPILLLVYMCEDYPTEVSDFTKNACNLGQSHDWAVFANSPSFTGCVEVGTMTHEFAHGINSQLTNSHYLNEMGAVMEGYADSIGESLAMLYGYKDEAYSDYVGSQYASPLRSFSNPYEFKNAKYIGGAYYISPVLESTAALFDYGGVHDNSSVVNYLFYCLHTSEDESEPVLDFGTAIDIFVETLYCATYSTGFEELGSYLIFAASYVDITEEQYAYVCETINNLGFKGESEVLQQLIEEEGAPLYSMTVALPDSFSDTFSLGVNLMYDLQDNFTTMGQPDENNYIGFRYPGELEVSLAYIKLLRNEDSRIMGAYLFPLTKDVESVIDIEYYESPVGTLVTPRNAKILAGFCYDYSIEDYNRICSSTNEFTIEAAGLYTFSIYCDDGTTRLMLVYVAE